MALRHRLERWVSAGLVAPDQAERILAFEKSRRRFGIVHAVAGLAGFAMAVGVVSIVAANWDLVPGRMKLTLDALCLALAGFAVARGHERGPRWLANAGAVVFYGLVLASIGLIGQVYQQGGNVAQALALWNLLSAPFMAYTRSVGVAVIWLVGLEASYVAALLELGDTEHSAFALGAAYFAPLALLGLGRVKALSERRPELVRAAQVLGSSELVLLASAGTFGFYERSVLLEDGGFWAAAVVSALATAGLFHTARRADAAERLERWLLVAFFGATYVPSLLPHAGVPVAAALSFMALWYVLALYAQRAGLRWLLNLATLMMGLRLLAVYFEVFGTLLDTGLGLLGFGCATLLVTWLWMRRRREIEREVAPGSPSEVPK